MGSYSQTDNEHVSERGSPCSQGHGPAGLKENDSKCNPAGCSTHRRCSHAAWASHVNSLSPPGLVAQGSTQLGPRIAWASGYAGAKCQPDSGKITYAGLTSTGAKQKQCAVRCIEYHEVFHVKDEAFQKACAKAEAAKRAMNAAKETANKMLREGVNRKHVEEYLETQRGILRQAVKDSKEADRQAEMRAWLATIKCFKKMQCYYSKPGMEQRKSVECPNPKGWVMTSEAAAEHYFESEEEEALLREKLKETVT